MTKVGAVVGQVEGGGWVVAYVGGRLTDSEATCHSLETEYSAAVWTPEKFRLYELILTSRLLPTALQQNT